MKHFIVHLKDGRQVNILAESYRRDGKQYVFDKPGSSEVEFFKVSAVSGIVEAPPSGPVSVPHTRPPLV